MKTIEQLMEQFAGKGILDAMAELFRKNDDDFRSDEIRYLAAVAHLRQEAPADISPSIDEYLAANEKDLITRIVYGGYHGFQINLANFQEPYGVDFTRMESFDIVKEHIIGDLPANEGTYRITDAFFHALPEHLREYESHISEYFTHFECAGPKLAHFAGYMLANKLLYYIQPGYQMDPVQTMQYESDMKDYCGYTPV